MARPTGSKNRNYPGLTLEQALAIPRAIQEGASGMAVSKLTLAGLVKSTPSSSAFRELILASRAYGLTTGGVNGDQFGLTELGAQATCGDDDEERKALRKAVMNVAPYREFLTQFNGKKVPVAPAFSEFLVKNAAVPSDRAQECMGYILADARLVGYLTSIKGSDWVDLNLTAPTQSTNATENDIDVEDDELESVGNPSFASFPVLAGGRDREPAASKVTETAKPMKVFVAHGKNRKPLEQMKAMLTELGVPFEVAIDEPHAGRPVSEKVATMMRETCSAAIVIFSADEKFLREEPDGQTVEVWRPSENAVYELGAASVLYGRKVIIFKEDRVKLPSDFSDIGHISFHADSGIQGQWTELLRELKAHGIVEIRVAA